MAFKMKPGSPMERNFPGAFKKEKKNIFSRFHNWMRGDYLKGQKSWIDSMKKNPKSNPTSRSFTKNQ